MTTRRVTANLPKDLLRIAQEVTGKGITETIVEGLDWYVAGAPDRC